MGSASARRRVRQVVVVSAVLAGLALFAGACSNGSPDQSNAAGDSERVSDPTAVATQAAGASSEPPEAFTAEPSPTPVTETEPPLTATTEPAATSRVIYAHDFESEPGDEWNTQTRSTTPSGRSFLGEFGDGTIVLELEGLPEHDALSVALDLFIIRSWEGGLDGGDRWRLEADHSRIVNVTFSNDEALQSFPQDLRLGANPGGTGAVETDSLGYTFRTDDNPADSVYRIERTFLHDHDQLRLDLSARNLQELADESWGIDNIEITAHTLPGRAPSTDLTFSMADGVISIAGTVPSAADHERVTAAVERHFDADRTGNIDVAVIEGGVAPLWLFSVSDLLQILEPSTDFEVAADERLAMVRGNVRTQAWHDVYVERLVRTFGGETATTIDIDVLLGEATVAEVESMRLLFPTGSSDLTDDHRATLDRLAELLAGEPELVVRVEGHTDLTGEDDANKDLSGDRAQAALDHLVLLDVNPDQLRRRSAAAQDPEVEEVTDADRATNRRVQFVIPRG